MKVFHELAYEGYVLPATALQFSDPRLMELLGTTDMLHVSGYATQVTGTTPVLAVYLQYSNDRSVWFQTSVAPVINGVSLSTSGETLFQGTDPAPNNPRFGYGRLQLSVGPGFDARALVRVWVTGRDFSPRAATKYARGHAHQNATHAAEHPQAHAVAAHGSSLVPSSGSPPHESSISPPPEAFVPLGTDHATLHVYAPAFLPGFVSGGFDRVTGGYVAHEETAAQPRTIFAEPDAIHLGAASATAPRAHGLVDLSGLAHSSYEEPRPTLATMAATDTVAFHVSSSPTSPGAPHGLVDLTHLLGGGTKPASTSSTSSMMATAPSAGSPHGLVDLAHILGDTKPTSTGPAPDALAFHSSSGSAFFPAHFTLPASNIWETTGVSASDDTRQLLQELSRLSHAELDGVISDVVSGRFTGELTASDRAVLGQATPQDWAALVQSIRTLG